MNKNMLSKACFHFFATVVLYFYRIMLSAFYIVFPMESCGIIGNWILFSDKCDFRSLTKESSVHLPTTAHPCSGRDDLEPERLCRGAAGGYRRGSQASRAGSNEPSP